MGGTGVKIFGEDIAVLDSKEHFRAVNIGQNFAFTTTGDVLGEYVRGFTGDYVAGAANRFDPDAAARAYPVDNAVVISQTTVPSWPGQAFGDDWWGA